ncbi:hypothetical protein ACLX1H_005523 [Fusarium chlamydosporum]
MPSSLTTSVFMPRYNIYEHFTPTATVISANPTATALRFVCLGTDPEKCENAGINNTIVVGPWADKTVTKGAASTGVFHFMMAKVESHVTSIECIMSSGIPQVCTATSMGDGESVTSTATGLDKIDMSFFSVPIVIVEGQDFLQTTATSTHDPNSVGTTASQDGSSDEASESGSASSAVRFFGAVFMAGWASLVVQS